MSAWETSMAANEVKHREGANGLRHFNSTSSLFVRFFTSLLTLFRTIKIQRRERSMRLCETLPLGEKRFLAIVQIERQRFLIAASNQSVSLLHCLDNASQPHHRHPVISSDSCEDEAR